MASCRMRGCLWFGRPCPDPDHSEPLGPVVSPGDRVEYLCRTCGVVASRAIVCCGSLTESFAAVSVTRPDAPPDR